MKQKSAVEWLEKKLIEAGLLFEVGEAIEIEQAKEMEKQQIIEAGNSCALEQHLHSDRINKMSESEIRKFADEKHLTFGEEYYNETFNK